MSKIPDPEYHYETFKVYMHEGPSEQILFQELHSGWYRIRTHTTYVDIPQTKITAYVHFLDFDKYMRNREMCADILISIEKITQEQLLIELKELGI